MGIRSFFLVLAATALPIAAPAQDSQPKPFPEFEAKRVRPPSARTSNRITVQIDPAPAPAPADDAMSAEAGDAAAPGRHGWFWDKIAADMSASGPGRLEKALMALSGDGSVAAPRLQHLQEIAQQRGVQILTESVGTQVSPALVLAVIAVESAGKADAVSAVGAQGLMQLMPDTATRFGVSDALEPQENIAGGIRYLDWLMGAFDGDPILVLAGYNAGEGAVREHQGVPPYAETRDYVPKVLAAFQVARGLCMTPPELISDGCVFRMGK
jgi:soluble lytic murein transglycosylase-like protein